jgi:glycerophosphoryl diester phosphodiesterase
MNFSDLPTPLVIAHRGFKARCPENTLVSFREAVDAGALMIELDVTLSRDRRVVVIHDETLDRTTNGRGPVRECSFEDLKALDAGGWFSEKFKGERIPSLDEVFDLFQGKTLVNVEIKPEAHESPMPDDAVEIQVLSLARSCSMTDRVIVSSFEKKVIGRIASMDGKKPLLAQLSEDPLDDETLGFMIRHTVFSYNPDYRTLTKDQVEKAHRSGLRVLTYTVNSGDDALKLAEMGVDGMFTDDPVMISRVLGFN